jgi:hypothetical protein
MRNRSGLLSPADAMWAEFGQPVCLPQLAPCAKPGELSCCSWGRRWLWLYLAAFCALAAVTDVQWWS